MERNVDMAQISDRKKNIHQMTLQNLDAEIVQDAANAVTVWVSR